RHAPAGGGMAQVRGLWQVVPANTAARPARRSEVHAGGTAVSRRRGRCGCGRCRRKTRTAMQRKRRRPVSVIQDSRPGDEIRCIEEFHASPAGELFSWETSRTFRVGERLRYTGLRKDEYYTSHPGLGWMVSFEAAD